MTTKCPKCGKRIYKTLDEDRVAKLITSGSVEQWDAISFASKLDRLHNQFGSAKISIDVKDLEKRGYQVIPIQYDFEWLKSRPKLLLKVTSRTAKEWEQWSIDNLDEINTNAITEEIKETYGWEKEVVVANKDDKFMLGNLYPVILYKEDVRIDKACPNVRKLQRKADG